MICDINLSSITWPVADNQEINDPTEKLFVDSFNELGLSQCINVPTHIKGRTLDLLITNSQQLLINASGFPITLFTVLHFVSGLPVNSPTRYTKPGKLLIP